ncbi:MAG: chlorite dismutase family protein, partial [Thermodesulfobacteriota bacterium]
MKEITDDIIDISEKGRAKDGSPLSSDKRLYIQFLAFGNCDDPSNLVRDIQDTGIHAVIYADLNDYKGIGVVTMSEYPDFFVHGLRDFLLNSSFKSLISKPEFTMFGRTYSFGYENDLEKTLVSGPREKMLDADSPWAIWYPLQRTKEFENLSDEKKRAILGEHGKIGFKFGKAGFAKDIRLACHGLDKNDNDFVIALLGKELYPLSAVIQTMRGTEQTSKYLEKLGPFFVGKAIWQSKI